MKGIVIYDTPYGNTRTIAETISETPSAPYRTVLMAQERRDHGIAD